MTSTPCSLSDVTTELNQAAFHPEAMEEYLKDCLFDEAILGYFAGAQMTFDRGSVARYANLFVVTPSRFIHIYASDLPVPDSDQAVHLEVQTVPLIKLISIETIYGHRATGGPVGDLLLTIGWGANSRIMLDFNNCEDPNCGANHGNGGITKEDVMIRVSAAADGGQRLAAAVEFARVLRRAQFNSVR